MTLEGSEENCKDISSNSISSSHMYVQTLNPVRGKMEWKPKPVDYDFKQEVARAAFADMLHDTERNHLYYVGLEAAIKKKRSEGQRVHVLDIGTGTGLLSMMAVRLGADTVTAIEEFDPIANCAEQVTRLNDCWDHINLIRKRSTAVSVGPGPDDDMAERANILVTEVLDTELIGEAAISTYNHAHKHLLTADCEVVPCEATVYVQLVDSDLADRWNRLREISFSTRDGAQVDISPPLETHSTASAGSLALHDLQLSQMKPQWFSVLTKPIPVFKFDFGSGSGGRIPKNEQTVHSAELVTGTNDGNKCSAVFMWWDIWMDPAKTVLLSCAPVWAHPNPKSLPWRDHWMQAIYYPLVRQQPPHDPNDRRVTVVSNHDEFSYWFDVWQGDHASGGDAVAQLPMPHPADAGIHLAVGRTRLGQINSRDRNQKLASALEKLIDTHLQGNLSSSPDLNVLCLSEQSILPVIFGAIYECKAKGVGDRQVAKLYVCSKREGAPEQMHKILEQYFASCDFKHSKLVRIEGDVSELDISQLPDKVDMAIGEPSFSFSLLPWHNLFLWYSVHSLIDFNNSAGDCPTNNTKGGNVTSSSTMKKHMSHGSLMPLKATLWALPVHYHNLWKIRAPVQTTEGFNLQPFDTLIMKASDGCDENVEPHPLWEYPCVALGSPHPLAEFKFTTQIEGMVTETMLPFKTHDDHDLNGMALWMDWHLDDDVTISTGPVETVSFGTDVSWDVHSKQGVHLFPKHRNHIQSSQISPKAVVKANLTFDAAEGDILFDFTVIP